MQFNRLSLWAIVGGILFGTLAAPNRARRPAALSGQVTSAQEARMEGVLVNVKREGSTITTTVVTNEEGRYSFPADRVQPGKYTISIRAVGYILDGPKTVEIPAGGNATADLKLNRARNIHLQLSNAEWMASLPGTDREKQFLTGCTGCHTLQRLFTAQHDVDEWIQVFNRMGRYYPGSTPAQPQLLVSGGARSERPRVDPKVAQAAAQFLVDVSLSNPEAKEYDFKPLPRPKGRATRVIITEYDLPRKNALSARRGRRCRRPGLVLRLRLAGHGRARSQDRQGHRLRHPGGAAPSSPRARSISSSTVTAISGLR